MPLLVEPDSAWAQALAAGIPGPTQILDSLSQLDAVLAAALDHTVVLGPNIEIGEALVAAEKVRSRYPVVGLVLLRHTPEADVFQAAMRAGIPAVLDAGDREGLSAAVDRNRQTLEAMRGPSQDSPGKHAQVITVFSPKGGVGKTTVTVNLAAALAGRGLDVCVLDLDLAWGDVAITLQLIPEHTIAEAVGSEEHLDYSLLGTLLTTHETCSILAAPTDPDGKDRITPTLVSRVIRVLRGQFDVVLIDTAAGFDNQVLHAFDETDECVLVSTLDVPTVKNMKVAIERLDELQLAVGHRHLVLNRADDEVGLSAHHVETLLKMPVAAAMPSATAVAHATNHGKPIILAKPDHAISKTFAALGERLASAAQASPESIKNNGSGPMENTAAKRRLFGRRRK